MKKRRDIRVMVHFCFETAAYSETEMDLIEKELTKTLTEWGRQTLQEQINTIKKLPKPVICVAEYRPETTSLGKVYCFLLQSYSQTYGTETRFYIGRQEFAWRKFTEYKNQAIEESKEPPDLSQEGIGYYGRSTN
jgi:hypothetical protein